MFLDADACLYVCGMVYTHDIREGQTKEQKRSVSTAPENNHARRWAWAYVSSYVPPSPLKSVGAAPIEICPARIQSVLA